MPAGTRFPRTPRYAAAKAGLRPPEYNPFANNIAQAVELVDVLDRCAALCRRLAGRRVRGLKRAGALRGARRSRRGLHRGPARGAVPHPGHRRRGPHRARLHHDAHGPEHREPGGGHAPARRARWSPAATTPTSSPWKWRSSSAPTTPASPAACTNAFVRSRGRRPALTTNPRRGDRGRSSSRKAILPEEGGAELRPYGRGVHLWSF